MQSRIGGEDFKHAWTRGGYRNCGLCDDWEGRIRCGRDVWEDAPEVVARPAHKRIAETAEISAVLHFLCEDVGYVAFPADVGNGDGAVGDPFTCRILLVLNVTIAFGGHIVTPFNACIVIVIEGSGRLTVGDGVAEVGKTRNHVAGVDREAGAHVGSPNLGVTRAEGSAFLTLRFPCDWTAGPQDDNSAHTSELEQRQLDTFAYRVPKLGSPASVAIGGEAMVLRRRRWKCIAVSFSVG